jgi:peptidoglycan-associated lipoprotein
MRRLPLLVLAALTAVAAGVACPGNPPPATPTPVNEDSIREAEERARAEREQAEREAREREEADRLRQQQIADSLAALGRTSEAVRTLLATTIHFDYDKSNIRSDDAGVLDQKVAILQTNSDLRIRISGHCDERGSDEYNLALGNRRATSAKQYLVSHGIDAGRIETVSYGEERSVDPGHDEGAWSRNRRDEFEIISGGDALRQP